MRIKNWSKFQHFKDRRPPWVKLYRDLLDDREWHQLEPRAAKLLVMLWLIASEDDGNLPDVGEIAFRLRTTDAQVQDALSKLSHWLEQDDIKTISEWYPSDPLETETETEKRQRPARKCPSDFEVTPELRDWAARECAGVDVDRETAKLRDHTFRNARSDWPAVWRNWMREALDRMPKGRVPIAVTVPCHPNAGAALEKLKADAAKAVPPPPEIRAQIAKALEGKVH